MTEIDTLVRLLPSEIQPVTEGILEKVGRIKAFTWREGLSPEKIEKEIDEVFARFNTKWHNAERVSTFVITSRSEPEQSDHDAKWTVLIAGAMINCRDVYPSKYPLGINQARVTIIQQLVDRVREQTASSYYAGLYSGLALELALTSDTESVKRFYPNGNPIEPLLNLCVMGVRPLGIINKDFVVCIPQK